MRLFKLAGNEIIVFAEDYRKKIGEIYDEVLEDDPEAGRLVRIFLEEIAQKWKDHVISRENAVKIFDVPHHDKLRELVRLGLLILNGSDSYRIAIPSFGSFSKWVANGRDEILALVAKLPHGEISQTVRSTKLSSNLH